jgi:nucleoside-diphosphate-sugar epimerase
VRYNIHAADLVGAFDAYAQDRRPDEVSNIGGGREVNCSMLKAIAFCEEIAGRRLDWTYSETNRGGRPHGVDLRYAQVPPALSWVVEGARPQDDPRRDRRRGWAVDVAGPQPAQEGRS